MNDDGINLGKGYLYQKEFNCRIEDIGGILKAFRSYRGFTLSEVGERADCSANTIYNAENRKKVVVSLENLKKAFEALGFDLQFYVKLKEGEEIE